MSVRKKNADNAKREQLASQVTGLKLWGRIVTWKPGNGKASHTAVLASLQQAGLDAKYAKELEPRHAFTRVASSMKKDGVIDFLRNDSADLVTFQFTKKFLAQDEWKYEKEAELQLDKVTGRVKCAIDSLRERAQRMLDEAIANRTSSDITKMVQDIFEDHADLIPLREKGGVYFVPLQFDTFISKVATFLEGVGGRLDPFPVPMGDQAGDQAIQNAVSTNFKEVVDAHLQAINDFDINSRSDTLERRAELVKLTRVKVEAYAHFLAETRDELLEGLKQADETLTKKLEGGQTARAEKIANGDPVRSVKRGTIFDFPVTAVLRWMGKERWTFEQARKVVNSHGCDEIADATVRAQLLAGRKGERGDPAKLNKSQIQELNKAI